MEERILTNEQLEEDKFEQNIRPEKLDDYIGQ